MKKYLFGLGILFLISIVFLVGCTNQSVKKEITNFEQCAAAGNPVMESFPRQCRAGDNTFTEQLVGGDRDDHGCIGSAGYSWCESKQKCLRTWEEDCSTQQQSCILGSDCIPLPSECHPVICINKKYESNYKKPEMCTMEFRFDAAYNPEDCACVDGFCINKNKGRTSDIELTSSTIEEALVIAESSECTAKGTLVETYFYNENSKTWWIDLRMKDEFEKNGCNPACVVSEETKTAEINWRCTGLITE
jgi:hypothetical protein